jgi:ribose transport system permease protein
MADIEAGDSEAKQGEIKFSWIGLVSRYGVVIALFLTIGIFSALRPDAFMTMGNLDAILRQAAPLAVIAMGLTVVLVMGDFDLSFGPMVGLGGALIVSLMAFNGMNPLVAILIGLAVGTALGALNGFLIAYVGVSSFIITLAASSVITGIEFAITKQRTIVQNIPDAYNKLAGGSILGVNNKIYIAAVISAVMYVVLRHLEIGRYMYAIGGNPEAARLSGINVKLLRAIGFVVVAFLSVVAGIMLTSTADSSFPNQGVSFLLPGFAAVFLGSTVIEQGEFNPLGTLVGVAFLGVVATGLTMLQLSLATINIVHGLILALAVVFSRLAQRRET